jgi:hypothetical protein
MSDSEHVGERREGYLGLFARVDTEAALVDVASASAVSMNARVVHLKKKKSGLEGASAWRIRCHDRGWAIREFGGVRREERGESMYCGLI